MYLSSKDFYIGTNFGVYKSSNSGSSWTLIDSNFSVKSIKVITKINSDVIAGSYGDGLYKLSSTGLYWIQSNLSGIYINFNNHERL